jgi:hypothetical protein
MEIVLPQDFKEFLQFINENRVEYLVVGGYAVGYHGYPRATGDIDFWVAATPENVANLGKALIQFGFSPAIVANDFSLREPDGIHIGVPPLRIDLLTSISGANFAECFPHRVVGILDGVTANIIDLASLRKNKQAARRLKDLNDLEHLPDS